MRIVPRDKRVTARFIHQVTYLPACATSTIGSRASLVLVRACPRRIIGDRLHRSPCFKTNIPPRATVGLIWVLQVSLPSGRTLLVHPMVSPRAMYKPIPRTRICPLRRTQQAATQNHRHTRNSRENGEIYMMMHSVNQPRISHSSTGIGQPLNLSTMMHSFQRKLLFRILIVAAGPSMVVFNLIFLTLMVRSKSSPTTQPYVTHSSTLRSPQATYFYPL